MPTWTVKLFDSENNLLGSSEVEADVYSQALEAARAQRRDVLGKNQAIKLERRAARLQATLEAKTHY